MNKRARGSEWEHIAGEFLQRHGIRIIEYNFRSRFGEIDIVGEDEKYLIFFEVKYRSTDRFGSAQEAVDFRKQQIIIKVSDYYRVLHKISPLHPIRYDVVAINNKNIKWIPGAFGVPGL